MSGRIGVEIGPGTLRIVRLAPVTGRVTAAEELPWDPARPVDGVAAARTRFPRADRLSIAIGLGWLEVARVALPPVAPDEQIRIVELEPDRYFAAAGAEPFAASLVPESRLAFAMPAASLDAWLSAFDTWGPVERVEPAPVALARVLPDGAWHLDAADGEHGLLRLDHGRIVEVRRMPRPSNAASPVPPVPGVDSRFAAALATVRRAPRTNVPALAPPPWRRRLAARRRDTLLVASLAAAAAIGLAGWSANRWRERALAALDARVEAIAAEARPAEEALRRLQSRRTEANVIAAVLARRADPLLALATISSALPREVTVLSARASGAHWQLDGTTTDASVLVPLLDRHAAFDSVRALGATSRYREGNRSYETFSLALRHRSRP